MTINKNHTKAKIKMPALSSIIRLGFTPLGESIAQSMVDELEVKGGLLGSKPAYIEQKKKEILDDVEDEFLKLEEYLARGGTIIGEKLKLLPVVEQKKIGKELEKMAKAVDSFLTIPPKELSSKEEVLQVKMGLSNETLLWIYSIGYQLSTENNYEDALPIFKVLTTLNPLVVDYFIAQGLSERALQYNEEALYSFAMAILLNPNHLLARYNSAEIYLNLHQTADAEAELEVLEDIVRTENLTDFKPMIGALRSKITLSKGF